MNGVKLIWQFFCLVNGTSQLLQLHLSISWGQIQELPTHPLQFGQLGHGSMVYQLEQSLVKQEDLGSIPAQNKWFFFSLLGYMEVGKMDPDMINWVILHIHADKR